MFSLQKVMISAIRSQILNLKINLNMEKINNFGKE